MQAVKARSITWAEFFTDGLPEGYAGARFPGGLTDYSLCSDCCKEEPEEHKVWRMDPINAWAMDRFRCDLLPTLDHCDLCGKKS